MHFIPKHHSNCQTMGVVYMLLCSCNCFYVGKTVQKLWQRLYRHIRAVQTADPDLPLGRHVAQVHEGICPKISVLVLDRLHPSSRGRDFNKILLQRELRWISNLNATLPPGLNEAFNLKPFLPGFATGGYDNELWTFNLINALLFLFISFSFFFFFYFSHLQDHLRCISCICFTPLSSKIIYTVYLIIMLLCHEGLSHYVHSICPVFLFTRFLFLFFNFLGTIWFCTDVYLTSL